MKRTQFKKIKQAFSPHAAEAKKEKLRQAYFEAAQDEGQNEVRMEWNETIGDGSDEWYKSTRYTPKDSKVGR